MKRLKTYIAEDAIQSGYIWPNYVDYVNNVCQSIGLPLIPIRNGRMCRCATFRHDLDVLFVFPKWSRTQKTMLHEIAHYIEYIVYGKTGHGKNFQICYEGLLSIYLPDQLVVYQQTMKK